MSNGGAEEFAKMHDIYHKAELHAEKIRALSTWGCVPHNDIVEKVINLMLDESTVRTQDVFYPFKSVSCNPVAPGRMWRVVQERWEEVDRRFNQSNMNMLGRLIKLATGNFTTIQQAEEVEAFFTT
eukprot:Colp12_sorted_trinity150504_noHs@19774